MMGKGWGGAGTSAGVGGMGMCMISCKVTFFVLFCYSCLVIRARIYDTSFSCSAFYSSSDEFLIMSMALLQFQLV